MRHFLSAASALGCRYVLAAVFLMAAMTKITDLPGFADQLVLHSGLPFRFALAIAAVLPWLELTCGVYLGLGQATREAALLSSVLLIGMLGYALTHLGQTDCRCFLFPTRMSESVWWPPIRDGLLLLCGLWTCRRVS